MAVAIQRPWAETRRVRGRLQGGIESAERLQIVRRAGYAGWRDTDWGVGPVGSGEALFHDRGGRAQGRRDRRQRAVPDGGAAGGRRLRNQETRRDRSLGGVDVRLAA